MKKYLMILLIGVLTFTLMSNSGCEPQPPTVQQMEQRAVENNAKQLQNKSSLPKMDMPMDRINTKRRLETFDDENKLSYIYLISHGQIMAYYPVLGKVTSGNKRLTTKQKLVNDRWSQSQAQHVMEAPGLDGTYGSSNSYIYFWTPDGVYVQWNDTYMLCDAPLKLTQKPILTYSVDKVLN